MFSVIHSAFALLKWKKINIFQTTPGSLRKTNPTKENDRCSLSFVQYINLNSHCCGQSYFICSIVPLSDDWLCLQKWSIIWSESVSAGNCLESLRTAFTIFFLYTPWNKRHVSIFSFYSKVNRIIELNFSIDIFFSSHKSKYNCKAKSSSLG